MLTNQDKVELDNFALYLRRWAIELEQAAAGNAQALAEIARKTNGDGHIVLGTKIRVLSEVCRGCGTICGGPLEITTMVACDELNISAGDRVCADCSDKIDALEKAVNG